jgi:hypothetical protein
MYGTHMEDPMKDTEPSLEDNPFFKENEDVFEELPRLPTKRDIDFSIELIPRAAPIYKTP